MVGASSPTDQSNAFNGSLAFVWTRERGIHSLGALPGDVASAAQGINDEGEISGISVDAQGDVRAVLWRHGAIVDLNELSFPDSPFSVLLDAFNVNDAGEIIGFGVTTSGDIHGFLLTPCDRYDEGWYPQPHMHDPAEFPAYIREFMRGRHGTR